MAARTFDRLKLSSATRTIWIFGAGASHTPPYDLPLQKDMLRRFMTMDRPGPLPAQLNLDKLRAEVFDLITAVLPGATPDNVGLEELFSAYELQVSHPRSNQDERANAAKAIRTLQRALVTAVQAYGRGDSYRWTPYRRSGKSAPYAELLERLFPVSASAEDIRKHTLATMNYDVHLDRCAIKMRLHYAGDIDLDYGFELANYRIPGGFTRPRERSILLLRLHGALNWLRCLACQAVFTTVSSQASIDERERCELCKTESLDRVLVHPSFLRSYSDPLLQMTWGRMQEELTASDRWIFVGYSFPDPDVHLRDVLRHALRTRRTNKLGTEAVWAGYRASSVDANWSAECNRYEAMFGNDLLAWNATDKGFSDFVNVLDD